MKHPGGTRSRPAGAAALPPALFLLCVLAAGPSLADIIVTDGLDYALGLNDGAYIPDSRAHASEFAARDITRHRPNTDGAGEATRAFTLDDIAIIESGGDRFFNFTYDSQEVNRISGAGDPQITLEAIAISAGGFLIWSSAEPIVLNPNDGATAYTATHHAAGGDLELYVPVSLFYGKGLTGSSALDLYSSVSGNDAAHEEWIAKKGDGPAFSSYSGLFEDVPEPAILLLVFFGLIGVMILERAFNK